MDTAQPRNLSALGFADDLPNPKRSWSFLASAIALTMAVVDSALVNVAPSDVGPGVFRLIQHQPSELSMPTSWPTVLLRLLMCLRVGLSPDGANYDGKLRQSPIASSNPRPAPN
jgi:hypothetical protein